MIIVNTPWQGKKRFKLEERNNCICLVHWQIKDGCLIIDHGVAEVTVFAAGHWIGLEERDE